MPKDKETICKDDMYSGKNDGLTFEKFDDIVISWCREKYGDKYALALWKDELMQLGSLDLKDDLDNYGFETYCEWMFDILSLESPRYAAELWKSERFWTKKWQLEQRQRQREKLFCYLEKLTSGEAKRQLVKRGVGHMASMRKYFFDRFGAGEPEGLAERTKHYLLGMPGKDGEMFPPRCNMETKLDKLETEREYLVEMCPKDKRDTYEDGKEHTLVRIILRHIPAEYDAAVKNVKNMMKLRKFGESGNFAGFTNKEDHTRVNYDSDWLPPYDELRVELVGEWRLQERRRKDVGRSIKKHPGFPTLPVLPGHEQPGPHRRNCFSCGLLDHVSGDPICKAGPNDVWKGAPASWKAKMGKPKGKGGKGKGGKGKGKIYQRNLGDRKPIEDKAANDGICHNWSRGNGYCKFGPNCNFKHEGPKGGKRKNPTSSMVAAGQSKGNGRPKKKRKSALLVRGNKDEKVIDREHSEDDDEVYRLIRGAPSFVVTRSAEESKAYRPKWLQNEEKRAEGMGYLEPPPSTPYDNYCNKNEVKFFVTLMMSGKEKKKGFVPNYLNPDDERKSPDAAKSSDSSSSSDSDEISLPPPKFKIGDKIKWKRKPSDLVIQGTGTITRVKCARSYTGVGSSSVDSYRYEIASLEEPEPGIWTRKYEFCNEELIRILGSGEKLDQEETIEVLQQQDSQRGKPPKEDSKHLGLKPVEKPITSKIKTSVLKIDQNVSLGDQKLFKDLRDWSVGSSVKDKSPWKNVNEETRSGKNNDWSVPVGRNESSDMTRSSPLKSPGLKLRVRLGIKLVFPGGERESQTYSVHKYLSVQVFIQRMRNDLMKTTNQISLFVSPNWKLLNHTGTVSDEVIPGTNITCPFLYQGATVRIEWGNRQVSLVGDTVISPKRPARGGEWGNKSPDESLREIKGVSAGPVKWYSRDRPRASQQLMESSDTTNEPQLKRKRGESRQALNKAQVADKPKPLKGGKRKIELNKGQRCDTPDPRGVSRIVDGTVSNVGHGIGDDVVMIVKIRKNDCEGTQQAFVDFQFTENRGDTGPFKMGVTVGQLLNYYDQWKTDTESDSESTSSESDEEKSKDETSTSGDDSSGSDEDNPDAGISRETHQDSSKEINGVQGESSKKSSSDGKNDPDPDMNVDEVGNVPEGTDKFRVEQLVYFWDSSRSNHWVGVVRSIRKPNPAEGENLIVRYWIEPEGEGSYRLPCKLVHEKDIRPLELKLWEMAKRSTRTSTCLPIHESPLLPLHCVGVDTCSALSVSSERSDFPILDESYEAKQSISLRGIGGEHSSVGGRGPMLISVLDRHGRVVYMVDPLGVYLPETSSVRLRILGQQRMKAFGFNLVQNLDGDGRDYLVYKPSSVSNGNISMIPLNTKDGILMLNTVKLNFTKKHKDIVEKYIRTLCGEAEGTDADYLFHFETNKFCPVLIMNEATLDDQERRRLEHWRYAHRSLDGSRHNERCPACEQAKHKSGSFKRNKEYIGTGIATLTVYWRLYCDGYGGQQSMGGESYQGAKGGFVFVCPVSGRIKVKLYASTKQYPAILYQILQEVESEGYAVREIYVDTHIVNISAAAEDVAAMFKVRIVPISAGTPQELAYAERAVQTLAQMSRALMAGAPHLPQEMWGCSDIYAAYLHLTLPQKSKDMMTPYEKTTGRAPNLDAMFIKVFGCACQYEPHGGAEHKRGSKTSWGWFVGIQWPMVLILRPSDKKVISVSRKKVHCHEQCYAKFDPTTQTRPLVTFTDFTLVEGEIDDAIAEAKTMDKKALKKFKKDHGIPKHVPSVKSLSDFNRNSILNEDPEVSKIPENMVSDLPQESHLGEEEAQQPDLFEKRLNKDDLLEEIKGWKRKISNGAGDSLTDKIIKALNVVESDINDQAPKRGELKRKKRDRMDVKGIVQANIIPDKRNEDSDPKRWTKNTKVKDLNIKVGDQVRIATHRFGKEYARGLPKFTLGKVISLLGDKAKVRWKQGDEDSVSHLSLKINGKEGITLTTRSDELPTLGKGPLNKYPNNVCGMSIDEYMEADRGMFDEWEQDVMKYPTKWNADTILPIMEVGSCISGSELGGTWPRDFYEALIRPDWRRWIEAVKDENESWNVFDACHEVTYDSIEKGASVIPLGELFTIKRNGKYKFRQIALGNLLKEGKDYAETFASTISGDGIRWFYAIASSCGRKIYGWDAKTGYLQTEQRIPIYAYLPSHYGYSNLTFEELAHLRAEMIQLLKKEGIAGVKRFSGEMKKERRIRPKTVLKLNRSIYGVPDAGQSFAMFMQSLHIKRCGMVQSELDPCIYYKIMQRNDGHSEQDEPILEEFLLAITWVDDVRYFGTDRLVNEYEKTIQQHCKCTLEGVSSEFVSIEIVHDVEGKTLEMKQEEYWVKAVERFKEYLGKDGPKARLVPLSVADEKLLIEPTDAEITEAQGLPFPSLLGVVQYPSCYTKIEMKYSMSILSRWRTKWGPNHFKVLLKALEYGYATRKRGLKYNGNTGGKTEVNVMEGFADASLSVPRSQGSRSIRLNGAAITMTSKRHSTTDDSSTASELTEAYLLSCEIEGFRNLMSEVGLRQKGPTILYQDNKAAIQIAMNRGSLSRKTRGTDLRVLTLRNKVEDLKVVPIYLYTKDMLIDLGTKALDPKPFCHLCDMLCGYAERVTTEKLDIENYMDDSYEPHPKQATWLRNEGQ